MALIERWNIRDESYSNAADVEDFTGQINGLVLDAIAGADLPTYNAAEDAIEFDGSQTIGATGTPVSNLLNTIFQAGICSVFWLSKQTTVQAGGPTTAFSMGTSASAGPFYLNEQNGDDQSIRFRDGTSTNAASPGLNNLLVDDTWQVHGIINDGDDYYLYIDGNLSSAASLGSADPTTLTWDNIALGSRFRGGGANQNYTGFIRELRIYDTFEFDNLETIDDEIQAGVVGGGLTTVTTDLQASWNIINEVSTDKTLTWNIKNQVVSNRQITWNILERIEANIQTRWNILNSAQTDLQILWNINELTQVNTDLSLVWNVLNSENTDMQTHWNILNELNLDVSLAWNVLNSTENQLSVLWNINGRVSSNLSLVWNIKNAVSSDLVMIWNTLNQVNSELLTTWNVLNSLNSEMLLQWTVVERLDSVLVLRWNVDSENSFPDIHGRVTINTKTGKVTMLSDTGKITFN